MFYNMRNTYVLTDMFKTPLCPLFLQCLSVPTELPGTFPRPVNHLYGPRLWLANKSFILGPTSWAIIINFFIYLHKHSWQCLPFLERPLILGLDLRPNIYIDNELLGPIPLHKSLTSSKLEICCKNPSIHLPTKNKEDFVFKSRHYLHKSCIEEIF